MYTQIKGGDGLSIPEEERDLKSFNQIEDIKNFFVLSAQYVSKFLTHKILVVDRKC